MTPDLHNPGGLVAGLKLAELGRVSRPRNPLLFALMHRMDLAEDVGSGIRRIRGAMKRYGLEAPLIEAGDTWFSVTFRRKPQQVGIEQAPEERGPGLGERLGDKLGERLGERRYRIVALMKRDPSISIPALAKRLGISTTAVEKNIKFLKQTGFVARSGPAKGGRWVVSD